MKPDPILAVEDVPASSKWYQQAFDCRSMHGGEEFEVLLDPQGEIFLCLHKWGAHEHPSMLKPASPGNGLILYFRAKNWRDIHQNLLKMGHPLERDIQVNPNSGKQEFSLLDPNGYYLTVSEFHEFMG